MCLITEQKEPLIAEEDIEIWKALVIYPNGTLSAPYNYFDYILNNLYKVVMVANNIPSSYVDDIVGYAYDCIGDGFCFDEVASKLTNVYEGFHSFCDYDRAVQFIEETYYELVKGIIPKGSLYYKDKTGLIVSNQIMLTEILNDNK